VQEAAPQNAAKIEIGPPRRFTLSAVLIVTAYGLILGLPFVLALLALSLIRFDLLGLLIPLLALAVTAYLLPLGLGNPFVARLVRSLGPAPGTPEASFIVQLTLSPRIRSGLRAALEDADDVGWLSLSDSALQFQGDSVKLSVPFSSITQVRPQNIGLRGLYVYGRKVTVEVSGLPEVSALEFAERSSCLLPTSRRIARQMCEHLSKI
jgi:hypothetical protein